MIEVYKTIGGGARVGLELTQIETAVTTGLAVVSVLPADPSRIAVMFQSAKSAYITLGLSPQVQDKKGIVVVGDNLPVIINDWNMPGLAARAFWGVAEGDFTTLEVISVKLT